MKHRFLGAARGRPISVRRMIGHYGDWAKAYYAAAEWGTIDSALGVLGSLFGAIAAIRFGPLRLREVRDAMVARGWSRRYVNKQIHRLRAAFRWAGANELIPSAIYQALKTVEPLKRRRSLAPERLPILPVAARDVAAIEPFVRRRIWAAIELQRLTGARPGEILLLRAGDIDRSEKLWRTQLLNHKTQHQGQDRTIYFGPMAQNILRPWLLRAADEFLFSPAEAEDERIKEGTAARRIPQNQGHIAKGNRRPLGRCYSTASYRRAIARACLKAEIAVWHPNQLRHLAATEIRKRFGLEAAQLMLGHSSALVTDAVYANRDATVVEAIMWEIG